MLEDKLPELVRSIFNIKVMVSSSYKAKESLAAKGLTPAIFLDRFYRDKNQAKGGLEVGYFLSKEKYLRPLPEFTTIDQDDYELMRKPGMESFEDIDEPVLYKKIVE